jgi:hypothetical protein
MPQQLFTSGRFALGICDICGFRYPLHLLRMEPISAYGSPSNAPSGLKACPSCYDPSHPQSFLPLAVAAHGADAEQVIMPRPDIFPEAYPVSLSLPGALYRNSNQPLVLNVGFAGNVNAFGIFGGYSATANSPSSPYGVIINSAQMISPQLVVINLSIYSDATGGAYIVNVVDGTGNSMAGQILVPAGGYGTGGLGENPLGS